MGYRLDFVPRRYPGGYSLKVVNESTLPAGPTITALVAQTGTIDDFEGNWSNLVYTPPLSNATIVTLGAVTYPTANTSFAYSPANLTPGNYSMRLKGVTSLVNSTPTTQPGPILTLIMPEKPTGTVLTYTGLHQITFTFPEGLVNDNGHHLHGSAGGAGYTPSYNFTENPYVLDNVGLINNVTWGFQVLTYGRNDIDFLFRSGVAFCDPIILGPQAVIVPSADSPSIVLDATTSIAFNLDNVNLGDGVLIAWNAEDAIVNSAIVDNGNGTMSIDFTGIDPSEYLITLSVTDGESGENTSPIYVIWSGSSFEFETLPPGPAIEITSIGTDRVFWNVNPQPTSGYTTVVIYQDDVEFSRGFFPNPDGAVIGILTPGTAYTIQGTASNSDGSVFFSRPGPVHNFTSSSIGTANTVAANFEENTVSLIISEIQVPPQVAEFVESTVQSTPSGSATSVKAEFIESKHHIDTFNVGQARSLSNAEFVSVDLINPPVFGLFSISPNDGDTYDEQLDVLFAFTGGIAPYTVKVLIRSIAASGQMFGWSGSPYDDESGPILFDTFADDGSTKTRKYDMDDVLSYPEASGSGAIGQFIYDFYGGDGTPYEIKLRVIDADGRTTDTEYLQFSCFFEDGKQILVP